MAGGYKATLDVRGWKEHICCYCGVPYRYLVKTRKIGRGTSQPTALAAARGAGLRALAGQFEMRPCPACGHYQPDMIGAHRLGRHAVLLLLALVTFGSILVLGWAESIPPSFALCLLLLCGGLILIAATVVGAANPSRNPRAGKALAARLIEKKLMQPAAADKERDERARPVVIETGPGYWAATLLVATTLLLMPGAELVRLLGGWPSNPDWHPPIVGPGDTAWTWVQPEKPIESLRGHWRASGKGHVVNPRQLGLPQDNVPLFAVTSRDEPWPELAPTDPRDAVQPWVRVTFPNARELASKDVPIEITLTVQFPDADANQKVVTKEQAVKFAPLVRLASHRAGFLYGFYWSVGVLGGGVMFLLVMGYHLSRDAALKQTGLPTRVIPVSDEEAAAPVPPQPEEGKTEKLI